MGERREGECGPAEPLNLFWAWLFPYNFEKPVPNAAKFKGRWFDRGEPEGCDALVIKMYDRFREENATVVSKYPIENVPMKQMDFRHRLVRSNPVPVFSDFVRPEYMPGYDSMKYALYNWDQYNHCVGNLGEDHPTCRKQHWYYAKCSPAVLGNHLEEMEELGHYDLTRKWGVKRSRSFLPNYQPVKKNIPGAYEFYRSKRYLEKYDPEGDGEWYFPYVYVE